VRDPVHINIWHEGYDGEPHSEAGQQVSIDYHRADGGPRLKAQKRSDW
jgi:hypothetical protein